MVGNYVFLFILSAFVLPNTRINSHPVRKTLMERYVTYTDFVFYFRLPVNRKWHSN